MKFLNTDKIFHLTEADVTCMGALSPPLSSLTFFLSVFLMIMHDLFFSLKETCISDISFSIVFICNQTVMTHKLSKLLQGLKHIFADLLKEKQGEWL